MQCNAISFLLVIVTIVAESGSELARSRERERERQGLKLFSSYEDFFALFFSWIFLISLILLGWGYDGDHILLMGFN